MRQPILYDLEFRVCKTCKAIVSDIKPPIVPEFEPLFPEFNLEPILIPIIFKQIYERSNLFNFTINDFEDITHDEIVFGVEPFKIIVKGEKNFQIPFLIIPYCGQ